MEELHTKIYLYNTKGVKEIRRVSLQANSEWNSLTTLIGGMFSLADAQLTYEDNEKDRVLLETPMDWMECQRLGPYTVHQPLKLHVRKRYSKSKAVKGDDEIQLDPVQAYTTDGTAVPNDTDRLKDVAPAVVQRFISRDNPTDVPTWLQSAIHCSSEGGEVDFDVDVEKFAVCLSQQAFQKMEAGDHAGALELFQCAHLIKPENEKTLYNMACCNALLGDPGKAVECLMEAQLAGFKNYEHMLQDEDLASLRGDARFHAIMEEMIRDAPAEATNPQMEEAAATIEQPPSGQAEGEVIGSPVAVDPLAVQNESLEKLRLMGFLDDEANRRALEAAEGSVLKAIDFLFA